MQRSARRLFCALLGILTCTTLIAGPARAQGSKCLAGKLKAIAKKEKALLRCHAKAAATGSAASVEACRTKASNAFSAAMSKLTGCSGTTLDCEAQADSCTDSVRIALPDGSGGTGSSCEAARLKAAGKKASAKLRCYLKAAAKGVPVDTAPGGCLDKATTKFTAAFNKVSGCTGDGNAASVESLIDSECVSQLVTRACRMRTARTRTSRRAAARGPVSPVPSTRPTRPTAVPVPCVRTAATIPETGTTRKWSGSLSSSRRTPA